MDKYEQYERVFKQFDANKDGKICSVELKQCVGSIGSHITSEEAAVLLMDSDCDGLLCLDDFVRIVEGACEEEKASDLKEAFKMYEMEGSGCITPKSLRKMLSRLGEQRSVEECKIMIDHFDLNGDGLLCLNDFVRIVEGAGEDEKARDLKEAFKMYEMEGTGCITPKSLERMLNRLGERRSVDDCKNMIAHFDLNSDGVLNFDDFKAMMSC